MSVLKDHTLKINYLNILKYNHIMWVIVVNKNLNLHRDNRIAELIGDYSTQEYLAKRSSNSKYHSTSDIKFSLIFKTESGARRIIEQFNSDVQKNHYSNKFYWIEDYVLSIRKMTQDEWMSKIDVELSILDNKYKRQRDKLITKRNQYK